MKRLLVTGFEPFGQMDRNPSWECAQHLPERIGDMELVIRRLPVLWGTGTDTLRNFITELTPDAVLCLGMCYAPAIQIERLAINLCEEEREDNAGRVLLGEALLPGGPAAYFSTLPYRGMRDALVKAKIPAKYSFSAGTYLCNAAMYTALHVCEAAGTPAGFLHVPAMTGQSVGLPKIENLVKMDLKEIVRAVTICCEVIAEKLSPTA